MRPAKPFWIIVAALVIVAVVFAPPVQAQTDDSTLGLTTKILTTPAVWVFNAILYIIRLAVFGFLVVSAMLLNKAYVINILAMPASIPVVPMAWAALRDLANGIFLLVILWIAVTIIFGVEQWGGKRLLSRLILVALFINFSLLLVTIVFGFANAIAGIFAKSIPIQPGTFILNSMDVKSVGKVFDPAEIEKIKQEEKNRIANTANQIEQSAASGSLTQQTILPALGIQTAYAQEGVGKAGALVGCGVGILGALVGTTLTGGLGFLPSVGLALGLCGGGAIVLGYLDMLTGWVYGLVNSATNTAIRLIGQIVVMLVVAVTMLYGAIALFVRYIAMIILSVLAPLAFIAAAVPKMEKHFHTWLSEVFRRAFFLPVFFLSLYLGFYTIGLINLGAVSNLGPTTLDRIVIILVALCFIWFGARLARKSGGAVGEWAVGKVAQLGLLAAGGVGGLALRGATQAMARAPQKTQALAARLYRTPLVGKRLAGVVQKPLQTNQKDIEARKAEMQQFSPAQWADIYRSPMMSRNAKIAAAVLLAEKGKLSEIRGHEETAFRMAEAVGMGASFLKYDPTLAVINRGALSEREAIENAIENIDKTKISAEAHNLAMNPHAGVLLQAILKKATTKELSQIAQKNQLLMNNMMSYLDTLDMQRIDELKRYLGAQKTMLLTNYFNGSIANGIGPRLGWMPPRHW